MRVITDTGELPSLATIIIQGRGELNPYNQTLRFKSGKDYTIPNANSPVYNPSTQTYDFTWANQGPYVAFLSPLDGSIGSPIWGKIKLDYIDSTSAVAGDVITFNGSAVVWAAGGGGGGGSGTVTNVGTTGLISGGPITTTGTITTSMNTNKLVGRGTAGVGVMEEITLGTGLSLTGTTLNATTSAGGIKYGIATQVSSGVYTTTISGVASYTAGDVYVIKFDTVNDGASTLNINALGAINLYRNTNVNLVSGSIKANQTIEVVYDGTNFQCIGLITDQLVAYVHNAEGSTITKGQAVYAYQATGNKMSVKLARANSDATSAKTIGLVHDASITAGSDGYIIIQGVIEGINTSAFTAGDTLYLSGSTFGGFTNVKPYAPTHLVYVGIVERSNAGNGQIYVRCQNGYELDEIHDVDLITTPPTNDQLLTYESATSLWKNKSLGNILSVTSPITSSGGTAPIISTSMSTNRLIGRSTAGTGVMEEIQIGNFLTLSSGVLSSVPPTELSQEFTTAWNIAPSVITVTNGGGSTASTNTWLFVARYFSPNTTISQVGLRIDAFTTNVILRLAIYDSTYDSTNARFVPNNRVANSGAISVTGLGFYSYTLPSNIQVSGWVFFAVGFTGAGCSWRNVAGASILGLPAQIITGVPQGTSSSGRNGRFDNTTVSTSADPPNPWSGTLTQNNANIPAVYFYIP